MGLFKKKKTITAALYQLQSGKDEWKTLHQYMNTDKQKYALQIQATKSMIKYKSEGNTNKQTINNLIYWLNSFHEPLFTHKKTNYGTKLITKTQKLDENKIKSLVPNLKELLSYESYYDGALMIEYSIKLLYDDYDFDANEMIFNDYKFKIVKGLKRAIILEDNLPIQDNSSYEETIIDDITGEETVITKTKEAYIDIIGSNSRIITGGCLPNTEITLDLNILNEDGTEYLVSHNITTDDDGKFIFNLTGEETYIDEEDGLEKINSFDYFSLANNSNITLKYIVKETQIDEETNEEIEVDVEKNKIESIINRFKIEEEIGLDELGFISENEVYNYMNNLVKDSNLELLKNKFNIDVYDEQLAVEEVERFYRVLNPEDDTEEYIYDDTQCQVEVISKFKWEGHTQTTTVGNQTYTDYKYEVIEQIIWVPKSYILYDEIDDMFDSYFVEYIDNNDKRQIYMIENAENYIEEIDIQNQIRLSSALPIKGNIPSSSNRNAYKYWKLSLEKSSKKNKDYRKRPKNYEPAFYEIMQKEGDLNLVWAIQRTNFAPFLLKQCRKDKYWQKFLVRIMKFFDEKIVSFSDNFRNNKGTVFYVKSYTGDDAMSSEKMSAFRIRGVKKRIQSSVIPNKCYLGTELDNTDAMCLYINEPDFSNSTVEERQNGIFYYVNQYILDLTYWYGGYHFYTNYSDNWQLGDYGEYMQSLLKIVWGKGGIVKIPRQRDRRWTPISPDVASIDTSDKLITYKSNGLYLYSSFRIKSDGFNLDNIEDHELEELYNQPYDINFFHGDYITNVPCELATVDLGRDDYITVASPVGEGNTSIVYPNLLNLPNNTPSVEVLKELLRYDLTISNEKYRFYTKYGLGINNIDTLNGYAKKTNVPKYYKSFFGLYNIYSDVYKNGFSINPEWQQMINNENAQRQYEPSLNGNYSIPSVKNDNEKYSANVYIDWSWANPTRDNLEVVAGSSRVMDRDTGGYEGFDKPAYVRFKPNWIKNKIINRAKSILRNQNINFKFINGNNVSSEFKNNFLVDLEANYSYNRYKEVVIKKVRYYKPNFRTNSNFINWGRSEDNIKNMLDVVIPDDYEKDTYYIKYEPPCKNIHKGEVTRYGEKEAYDETFTYYNEIQLPSKITVIRIIYEYKLAGNSEFSGDDWNKIPSVYAKATSTRGKIDFIWCYEPDFTPRFPSKLWLKIPMCSKQVVALSTVFMSAKIQITIKVATTFFKILLVVVVIVVSYFTAGTGTAAIMPAAMAGMATLISFSSPEAGAIVGLIGALMSAGSSLAASAGTSSFSNVAINSIINLSVSAYNVYSVMQQSNKLSDELARQEAEAKNKELESKRKFEEMLQEGVNLSNYDVKSDFTEEMDMFYYVAYGGLLYDYEVFQSQTIDKPREIMESEYYNRLK